MGRPSDTLGRARDELAKTEEKMGTIDFKARSLVLSERSNDRCNQKAPIPTRW